MYCNFKYNYFLVSSDVGIPVSTKRSRLRHNSKAQIALEKGRIEFYMDPHRFILHNTVIKFVGNGICERVRTNKKNISILLYN